MVFEIAFQVEHQKNLQQVGLDPHSLVVYWQADQIVRSGAIFLDDVDIEGLLIEPFIGEDLVQVSSIVLVPHSGMLELSQLSHLQAILLCILPGEFLDVELLLVPLVDIAGGLILFIKESLLDILLHSYPSVDFYPVR